MEQFLLGLASGAVLTLFAELLRLRAEGKKRQRDGLDADRVRLAKLVPPLRRAIERADEIWIGMMIPENNVKPRSIPLDGDLRAVVAAWEDPSVGPLVQSNDVREGYAAARIMKWADHWEWLRKNGLRASIFDGDLVEPLAEAPDLPPGLNRADKACWYSAKHVSADLQSFREQIERFVPLY